jgi:hypothetical protein
MDPVCSSPRSLPAQQTFFIQIFGQRQEKTEKIGQKISYILPKIKIS